MTTAVIRFGSVVFEASIHKLLAVGADFHIDFDIRMKEESHPGVYMAVYAGLCLQLNIYYSRAETP